MSVAGGHQFHVGQAVRQESVEHGAQRRVVDARAIAGATWHVVRFDASEGAKLVGMAGEAIKRDIREAMRRANRSAADAAGGLDPAAEDPSEAKRRYAERARPVVRRLLRLLADVKKAAERFGIEPESVSLADAHAALDQFERDLTNRRRAAAQRRSSAARSDATP